MSTSINCQVKVLALSHIIMDTLFTMFDVVFNTIRFTCNGDNCCMMKYTV